MSDSLEAEKELYHFLKVAHPKWSQPRKGGPANIAKVVEKLRSIGVTDARTLVKRLDEGDTVNEALAVNGHLPLGRDAIENIQKQAAFIRSLEFMDIPQVRQVGAFAPVPQMLSGTRVSKALRPATGNANAKSMSTISASGPSGSFLVDKVSTQVVKERGTRGSRDERRERSYEDELETVGVDPSLYGSTGARLAFSLREPGVPNQWRRRPVTAEGNYAPSMYSTLTMPPRPMSMGTLTIRTEHNNHSSTSSAAGSARSPGRLGEDLMQPSTLRLRAQSIGSVGGLPADEDPLRSPSRQWLESRKANRMATTGSNCEQPPLDEFELARNMRRVGREMREQETPAHWLCAHNLTPLQQGEDMLKEQIALDERGRFERLVRPGSGVSEMRSHVARKIRCRLQTERQHDSKSVLNIQHKCMNIRKNIASLANLRRDLSSLRVRVQALGNEEQAEHA